MYGVVLMKPYTPDFFGLTQTVHSKSRTYDDSKVKAFTDVGNIKSMTKERWGRRSGCRASVAFTA